MNIVLLDADVVIDLHRLNAWDQVLKGNQIKISSTILREAYFYDDDQGRRHNLDILKDAGSKFQEVSQEARVLGEFLGQLDRDIRDGLHDGEAEALSLVRGDKSQFFCTSDKMAIRVLGIMGASSQGMSFEQLLKTSGLSKKLEYKHTEKFFKRYLQEGIIIRIQSGKVR